MRDDLIDSLIKPPVVRYARVDWSKVRCSDGSALRDRVIAETLASAAEPRERRDPHVPVHLDHTRTRVQSLAAAIAGASGSDLDLGSFGATGAFAD